MKHMDFKMTDDNVNRRRFMRVSIGAGLGAIIGRVTSDGRNADEHTESMKKGALVGAGAAVALEAAATGGFRRKHGHTKLEEEFGQQRKVDKEREAREGDEKTP